MQFKTTQPFNFHLQVEAFKQIKGRFEERLSSRDFVLFVYLILSEWVWDSYCCNKESNYD